MRRVLRTLFSGLIVVLLRASTAMAQATAQISGTVKDSSGGVLPGASVTATQTETGFKREAVSETDGALHPARPSHRAVSSRSRASGIPHVYPDRHRPAGE